MTILFTGKSRLLNFKTKANKSSQELFPQIEIAYANKDIAFRHLTILTLQQRTFQGGFHEEKKLVEPVVFGMGVAHLRIFVFNV